jgi:PEP-CTERM motif
MQMKCARIVLLGVAAILLAGAGQTVFADSITTGELNLGAPNFTATAMLTMTGGSSGTWSLTFIISNGTPNTVDINSFALQLFNAGASESFTVTSATLNGGSLGVWEEFADDKLNNGSSPDCNSTANRGWLCADTGQPTLNPFSIGSGQSATFVFSGTYTSTSAVSPLDLIASGCLVAGTCKLDGGSNNGNKWAVSAGMTVPEPASLVQLAAGLGLLGLAVMWRRKLVF